jgi:hypothetical protein
MLTNHQAMGSSSRQFGEDLRQDVLGISRAGHRPTEDLAPVDTPRRKALRVPQ